MEWSVVIDDELEWRIQHCWKPRWPGVRLLINRRLRQDLPTDPESFLGEILVPTGERSWVFTTAGETDYVGLPLRFAFYIRVDKASRQLFVSHGRASRIYL